MIFTNHLHQFREFPATSERGARSAWLRDLYFGIAYPVAVTNADGVFIKPIDSKIFSKTSWLHGESEFLTPHGIVRNGIEKGGFVGTTVDANVRYLVAVKAGASEECGFSDLFTENSGNPRRLALRCVVFRVSDKKVSDVGHVHRS